MSCLLTTGLSLGCRENSGSVREIYIGQFNGPTLAYSVSNMLIGTFSGGTVSFYKFEQPIETASFKEDEEINNENGTISYTQTVEITLWKLDAALKNIIKTLSQGNHRMILLDNMGMYHFLGADTGIRVSAGAGGVGKAVTDLNGYVLTFTGKNTQPAYQLSTSGALSVIV